jgi:hypothetical protein
VKAYSLSLNEAQDWMKALAAQKSDFPDTDDATLKLSFDATVPAMSEHTQSAVVNQLTLLKSIGDITSSPSLADGILWTDAYNFSP